MKEMNIMAKKQSTKRRTQVRDLPKKEKKLSKGDLKKLKGAVIMANTEGDFHFKNKKSTVDIGAFE